MNLRQTHLVSGNEQLITWIPVDRRVKKGSIISLNKETKQWNVKEIFSSTDSENIQSGWGLDLPKSIRTER